MAATAPRTNAKDLSTDEIQRLLEENYAYIKAIVDGQNLGRMQQMQEYQAKLQENLMLLAAVADAKPSGHGGSGQGGAGSGAGAPARAPP